MSSESNPTTPSFTKREGPAPKAQPEDTSDVALGEDGMPLNPGEQAVQFTSSGQDPANGDAKVEIGDGHLGTPKFVGLGKEELMKYANDPFWVRLRWILFILFWLIWLAMLAGAIVIILYAPKCSDKLEGPQDGPYYQIYLEKFVASGLLNDIDGGYVNHLKSLGVKSIIVSQFLQDDQSTGLSRVTDFKKIDIAHGGLEDFKKLVEKLKEKDIKVILQIIPNHSSFKHPWFTEKKDFYVIEDSDTANKSTWKPWLPNNENLRSWELVPGDSSKQYLHQFQRDEADLNYRNDEVIQEMNSVLEFWFDTGIDGFLLSDVSYLLEDLDKQQDQSATINNKKNPDIVKQLLDNTKWKTNRTETPYALLDVDRLSGIDDSIPYYAKNFIPISTSLAELPRNFTAEQLKEVLDKTYQKVPRHAITWRLSGPRLPRLNKKYGTERANALAAVAYMLRGQVILYYGDEYGIPASASDNDLDKSKESFRLSDATPAKIKYYTSLIQVHNDLNQTNAGGGSTEFHVSSDKPGIIILERSVNDKIYLVAANFGDKEAEADVKSVSGDKTVKVSVSTPNLNLELGSSVSGSIKLPALSAAILEVS